MYASAYAGVRVCLRVFGIWKNYPPPLSHSANLMVRTVRFICASVVSYLTWCGYMCDIHTYKHTCTHTHTHTHMIWCMYVGRQKVSYILLHGNRVNILTPYMVYSPHSHTHTLDLVYVCRVSESLMYSIARESCVHSHTLHGILFHSPTNLLL